MASLSHPRQAKPLIFRIVGSIALAAALAGCVPRSGRPPRPRADVAERPEARLPRLPAGETRNRVAVLVPLAGPDARLGQSLLNAANLALLDMGGEKIRITAYDTSQSAAAAANQALAEGSGLILGPLLAEDVRAAAPVAASMGVPVVAFSNDVSVAGQGVYLMGFNPGQSVQRVVDHARARGALRFAGLVPKDLYGARAGQALTMAVEGARAQLSGIQTFDRSPASIRAAARRLASAGRHDAVLIGIGPRLAADAAAPLRAVSPQPRLLATELWANEANPGAQVGLRGTWFAAPSDARFGAFRTRYRARYGREPFRLATLGYDAALLAISLADRWRLGRRFPERALRDAAGFSGVDGAFRFAEDGVAERALEVREVTAGGTRIVSPAPAGFD